MNFNQLMSEFHQKVKASEKMLAASPNPKYQQSVILDRLIWNQEKSLKGNEKLLYTRSEAYFAAKIPQYFLR